MTSTDSPTDGSHAGTDQVRFVAAAPVPTEWGTFTCHAFRAADGVEHLAFVRGDVADGVPPVVRVHSECLTGDVFGSRRCDCGPQLAAAMQRVADEDHGVVVYLRGHEGRGIGIAAKIGAYELQDRGLDTVDANLHLGLPVDTRDYTVAADILRHLGVREVRLMTNNPAKLDGLTAAGVPVAERIVVAAHVTPENERYLRTKRDRMGHVVEL
ncbi:MAG: GTP cyclohydrolase II [Ilumatobacteraceae bacterium]|jgi:3,4-dihydroxy 2-butanone 4-phosphate synthase/GTP cyclohydrolase II